MTNPTASSLAVAREFLGQIFWGDGIENVRRLALLLDQAEVRGRAMGLAEAAMIADKYSISTVAAQVRDEIRALKDTPK